MQRSTGSSSLVTQICSINMTSPTAGDVRITNDDAEGEISRQRLQESPMDEHSYTSFGQTPGPRSPSLRHRTMKSSNNSFTESGEAIGYEFIPRPENPVEAQRLANNYMFGFKKWKGHVTERPLEERSEIVKELYTDQKKLIHVPTLRPGNVIYTVLFGWWVALVYLILAALMSITWIGRPYGRFCLTLAGYFFWPFGKFIHQDDPEAYQSKLSDSEASGSRNSELTSSRLEGEASPLISHSDSGKYDHVHTKLMRRPESYIWFILGCPLLIALHLGVFLITWMTVIFIPISKVHMKAIRKLILMPPELLQVEDSSFSSSHPASDIVAYIHHAVNFYYYKYTVDGMNVIAVNLLVFVIFTLVCGYSSGEAYITPAVKFYFSLFAIIPLAYYIGMGITSISAQSNFAVGAVLNATFGSIVEIVLYVLTLLKGKKSGSNCYRILVRSGLVGTLLATLLLLPGLCMMIGGLKHRTQMFNVRSTAVSSTLLFVSLAGTFVPTIFSWAHGATESFDCNHCGIIENSTDPSNGTYIFPKSHNQLFNISCKRCSVIYETDALDINYYNDFTLPLVYTCSALLMCTYMVGLIFSLKTHKTHIHESFISQIDTGHRHGDSVAHWGRVKSFLILLISTILMSLVAEIMTANIDTILGSASVTPYFIGVTIIGVVPEIPEIANGIQFALHNNISLSIEVGTSIAVQVCMLQIPILVIINTIYDMDFFVMFDDIHVWSVVFAVLMINYSFQDGKCDYFQGFALIIVYLALIAMYFFSPIKVTC